MDGVARKSSQEVEIDHLLEEEFLCDPGFAGRFLAACGLEDCSLEVHDAIAQPSLSGEGFGDLLVEGACEGTRIALLVEDKITAGPALRQAERYARHAARMRDDGWDEVWTILVAPSSYRLRRDAYDFSVDLEKVAEIMQASDPRRLAHRRAIIARAIEKKQSTGVQMSDERMKEFRVQYLDHVAHWCAGAGVVFVFPELRASYYSDDSWISRIGHPLFPAGVALRHRLWTTVEKSAGQVDLTIREAGDDLRTRIAETLPGGWEVSAFSRDGIQHNSKPEPPDFSPGRKASCSMWVVFPGEEFRP